MDWETNQTQPLNKKKLVIAVLLVLAILLVIKYTAPNTNARFENTTSQTITQPPPLQQESWEQEEYGEYADYGEYGETTYPLTNACNHTSYGYPDYIGTQKEGQTCKDSIPSERDMECFANTPYNYDGIIDLTTGTSIPKITCCSADGTCQW